MHTGDNHTVHFIVPMTIRGSPNCLRGWISIQTDSVYEVYLRLRAREVAV